MAKYGAKYIQFAPFSATSPDESADAFPKYGDPVNLGALNKLTDNPTLNEAKAYGDNATQEHALEFKECPIDIEVTELPMAAAQVVLGNETNEDNDQHFKSEDNAPYGGLAFYCNKLINNAKKYQGIYYPKVKAQVQGEEYNTKGDSISFANDKLHFLAVTAKNGEWKVKSALLDSESAAKAWVDGKVKKTAG